MKRYAMVTRLRPEKADEYRRLHAAVWPAVVRQLREAGIQNLSIFLHADGGPGPCLFMYFEHSGVDLSGDLSRATANEETRRWDAACRACQLPVPGAAPGEMWAHAEEVCHLP